ncbi:MAG: Ig-like domain repeat protein, partial [Methanosphaera sp.]|nr:Ig-like domain repeat protein [Methanosphaera sp.]
NVTINSYKNIDVDPESTLTEAEKYITPIKIRAYTNKDNSIPIVINNVTINMESESYFIDWDNTNKPYTIPFCMEIVNYNNSDVTVTNCNINFNETALADDTNEYSTIWGAYLLKNAKFLNNTVNINGRQCVYGVVARGSNITIEDNTINSHSTGYYADGINVESQNISNVYIANNKLNVTAGYGINNNNNPHVAYGALILDYSYQGYKYLPNEYSIENVSYINNTIICDAGQSYGVEIYGGNNLNISDNKIYLTSRVPMGIGVIGENVTLSGNIVVANGTNNATETTVDHLTSRTVGIYTRFTSAGINITDNDINVTTGRGIFIDHSNNTVSYNNRLNVENYTYAVEISSGTANSIHDNYLVTPDLKGDESVFDYVGTDNIIENNLPKEVKEYFVVVDTTEFTPGQTATIQASINYGTKSSHEVATNISKGKISFKVDGKTLKDANGKVIYAKVTNGVAMIENYQIPDTWTEKTTIQAVYSGSSDVAKMSSEKTTITITATEPTITTEDVTATVGATVTLTATINTDATINTGKVVFKINGKSIKDTNGKVIYAKVSNNQVTIEYTLPESYAAGTYNITAVFISPDYDRLEDTKTLTITEA